MFAKRTDWSLAPNRLSQTLANLRAHGQPFLDLTVSNPTECGFSYDVPQILPALSQVDALKYSPIPAGLPSAGEAVAAYYAEHRCKVSANDLFLTTGTSEAYSFVFRLLCDPGDEVLIPTPSYPLFDFLADIQDVRLTRYPLHYDHGWFMDFHALQQAITPRTRAIIVVHPNNPTGHYCLPDQTAQLNQLCRSRDLALIADEVFLDFAHGEPRRPSFAGNSEVLTFTLSGLSKICGLPQMKLAWIALGGPEEKRNAARERLDVIADAYLSVSTPIQLAAPAMLQTRSDFHHQVLGRTKTNLAELDRQLSQHKSCSRLACEGGWTAVLRVPATQSDEDLSVELLTKAQVHVHPGHFYDFAANGFLVVSLIVPPQIFAEGISRLLRLF